MRSLEEMREERRQIREKFNAEMKAKIWELVYWNIKEDYHEDIQGDYEGTPKWDEEVMAIVDNVSDLCNSITQKIDNEREYYASGDAALDAADAKLHEKREG